MINHPIGHNVEIHEIDADENDEYENDENDEKLKNPVRDKLYKKIIQLKKEIYNSIIFTPNLDTKNAQNPRLIQVYLNNLNTLYKIMYDISNGNYIYNKHVISTFPINTHGIINETINEIIAFFKQNQIHDTTPLSDFIVRYMKETPFIQDAGLIHDD